MNSTENNCDNSQKFSVGSCKKKNVGNPCEKKSCTAILPFFLSTGNILSKKEFENGTDEWLNEE